jgi:hypothetical protein
MIPNIARTCQAFSLNSAATAMRDFVHLILYADLCAVSSAIEMLVKGYHQFEGSAKLKMVMIL